MESTAYQVDKIGITKRPATFTLNEFNELATSQLRRERWLRVAGLGAFRERKPTARVGRNATTGEQIKIPARTCLRFTPARVLKDIVLGVR